LLAGVAAFLTTPTAVVQSITKADNTSALNDTGSWVGGVVPGSGDTAIWNSTVTSANTVVLGADLDWQGIQVVDPAGDVTISAGNTLSLGSGGIDLSTATADLTIEAGLALTADQSWQAAAGRTITLAGDVTGSAGIIIGGSPVTTNTFLTTTAQPLFPNASLSTLATASGVMAGGFVNDLRRDRHHFRPDRRRCRRPAVHRCRHRRRQPRRQLHHLAKHVAAGRLERLHWPDRVHCEWRRHQLPPRRRPRHHAAKRRHQRFRL
jgi:hypothetical protein